MINHLIDIISKNPELTYSLPVNDFSVINLSHKHFDGISVSLTTSDEQVLLIAQLFNEEDVNPDKRDLLLEQLLQTTLIVPLSNFGKIDHRFVLYNAFTKNNLDDILPIEIESIFSNVIDVLDYYSDFLK